MEIKLGLNIVGSFDRQMAAGKGQYQTFSDSLQF